MIRQDVEPMPPNSDMHFLHNQFVNQHATGTESRLNAVKHDSDVRRLLDLRLICVVILPLNFIVAYLYTYLGIRHIISPSGL